MNEKSKGCVIIGASHAGINLAMSLRREGWKDNILVIGKEGEAPYHRPPLSKTVISGEKDPTTLDLLKPRGYEQAEIKLKLNAKVISINRVDKTIELDNGEIISYDKLGLATGSRVRKLNIPGHDLEHVYYLRTLQDCLNIRSYLSSCKNIVILGGGYIGLETAASLRKLGLGVTVVESMERVLSRVASQEVSSFYTKLHRSHGVEIITGVSAKELKGKGHVKKVVLNDGRELPADMVIIGVGVTPNTELAEKSGLSVDNGIVVDKFACTNDTNIVAVGDCTCHPNKLLGDMVRLESVPNSLEQAKSAAASICGTKKEYDALPWFWSDQYDSKLQIAGLNQGYNRTILRGNPNKNSFVCWYLKDSKLIAADCVNRPKEFTAAKKIIAAQVYLADEQLADDDFELKDII